MTAGQDAVFLIRQIPEINHVYRWRIPPNKQAAVDSTDALVTDVLKTSIHGSDRTAEIFETIAVNIFLGKDANVSLDQITTKLLKKFEDSDWTTNQIGEVSIDPDTDQFMQVFQFTERI